MLHRSPTLSVTLSSAPYVSAITRRPYRKSVLSNNLSSVIFAPLMRSEHVNLGAFNLDTHANLFDCINNLVASLPDVLSDTASSTTTISSTTSTQLSSEGSIECELLQQQNMQETGWLERVCEPWEGFDEKGLVRMVWREGFDKKESTRSRWEGVKRNQLWDDQRWARPHTFVRMDRNKLFGSTAL